MTPRRRLGCGGDGEDVANVEAGIAAEIILAERVHGKHPFVTVKGFWQANERIVGEADEPKFM